MHERQQSQMIQISDSGASLPGLDAPSPPLWLCFLPLKCGADSQLTVI